MRISASCVIVAIAFLCSAMLHPMSQDDPDLQIQLGGIMLRLGMAQEHVLRRLTVVYDVSHADNVPGLWTVTNRGGPPYRLIGRMQFHNGKLTVVHKSWGHDPSAGALAMALHDAVKTLGAGRARTCTASVEAVGTIGYNTVLKFGRHELRIFAPLDPNDSAGVDETIR